MHEARAEYPLIHLSVLARPNIAVAALLMLIYLGFRTTGASFVLPDYLTCVQGLRSLQIGDALNWIALLLRPPPPNPLIPSRGAFELMADVGWTPRSGKQP